MPIKGLSEKVRFPRLGKIRIGEKTEKGFPKSLDHFECPDEVKAVYGEAPKELDIMFPVDNEDMIFPQWFKMYGQTTGLKCKGDGIVANKFNKETSEFEEMDCQGEECPDYENKNCRRVATLQFLLPKVNGLGVYQIDTSSYNSILNINSTIRLIKGITKGRIAMVPLKLIVSRQKVQTNGKQQTVSILELRADDFRLENYLTPVAEPPTITQKEPALSIPQATEPPHIEVKLEEDEEDTQKAVEIIEYLKEAPDMKEFNHRLSEVQPDMRELPQKNREWAELEIESLRKELQKR